MGLYPRQFPVSLMSGWWKKYSQSSQFSSSFLTIIPEEVKSRFCNLVSLSSCPDGTRQDHADMANNCKNFRNSRVGSKSFAAKYHPNCWMKRGNFATFRLQLCQEVHKFNVNHSCSKYFFSLNCSYGIHKAFSLKNFAQIKWNKQKIRFP